MNAAIDAEPESSKRAAKDGMCNLLLIVANR